MWIRLAGCALIAGCGYPPLGILDGATGDAAIDVAGDGSNALTGCFPRWFNGTIELSSLQELTELRTAASDRDPWISEDGLRLYFDRTPGPKGQSDIFQAVRASPTAMFSSSMDLISVNTIDVDSRAALTRDETMLALATDRNVTGRVHIVISKRPDVMTMFGSPDDQYLAKVNGDANNHYDPFFTNDGLTLYLAPDSGVGKRQEIKVATRPDLNSDFTTPVNVEGITSPSASNADPALSADERLIVFSSVPGSGGNNDLYYATRPTSVDVFGTPVKIPSVNNNDYDDGDPMLSADGCELYFASTRGGSTYHLFRAQITK